MPIKYEFVGIDENYPAYIREHYTELVAKGLIGGQQVSQSIPSITITAEVSTCDRYETTLPMCLSSIINQTVKPDRLVIYDDGEQKDLRQLPPFDALLTMATERGIAWEVFSTPRQGQVANHQHALDTAQTDWILRVDDDCVLEPNVIEELVKAIGDDVGAVAPLIHHPGNVRERPEWVDGTMNDVSLGLNIQWFNWNGSVRQAEHLYSSFLYRVEAARKAGGYPQGLSRIGHREETLFTHAIVRAGYRVRVTPYAKMWHLRQSSGGIRGVGRKEMWEADEQVFQRRLAEWGVGSIPRKVIVLDCGLGDHYAFKSVLPQIRAAHHPDRELVLAVCYNEVFEGEDVKLISIADAKLLVGEDLSDYSLYKWMWDRNWQRPLGEAFRVMNT